LSTEETIEHQAHGTMISAELFLQPQPVPQSQNTLSQLSKLFL